MDYQHVVLKMLVLKYIAKYASKEKIKFESCIDMLTCICRNQAFEDQALAAYKKFMYEIIAKCDIGAQKTCHMLQKLSLIVYNREFMTLNVG